MFTYANNVLNAKKWLNLGRIIAFYYFKEKRQ